MTNAGAVDQFRILHTASATNYITVTGSNGAAPTLATNSGNININPSGGYTHFNYVLEFGLFIFANIASYLIGNGQIGYCSDCTIANPCAGGGTGALAKRLNGVNVCN